jgi:hypothetical protein
MTDRASLYMRLANAVMNEPAELPLAGRVCAVAQELLGADGASVTIDNLTMHRVTLCATDKRSSELENLQDVLGEGPCWDAFRTQLPVSTRVDRWAASRWPNFIPAAQQVVSPDGVLWSLPMHVDGDVIGTLSLYRLSGTSLAEPIDAAQALADTVAVILLHDLATEARHADTEGQAARTVVHQAVGMLMAQLGLGPDDAMTVLRAHAFTTSMQLTQVAQDIINGTLDLSDG